MRFVLEHRPTDKHMFKLGDLGLREIQCLRRVGESVEIVWRLARAAWGRGIATRAAEHALGDLFGRCGLAEVIAFTAEVNAPSRRLMERLGMRAAERFSHPALPPGHPLRAHLLYRLSAEFYASERSGA